MWEYGYSVLSIYYVLNRIPLEIGLLAMDRAETGFIDQRRLGINGRLRQIQVMLMPSH